MRVLEYQCTACAGDRPVVEQFARTSISVVRSGVFGVRTEERTQLLTPGFVLLGNAGQQYETSHEHGGGDRCLVFDFHGPTVEELADSRRPFATNVLPPLPRIEALRHLAERRLADGGDAIGLEELGVALAARVVEIASSGTTRPRPTGRRAVRDRIVAAVELIERRASEEVTLSDLAGAVGLSPFHFVREFKKETGVTPYRFLLQARVRRAIALLRDTSEPVTDIAYDVGFGDLSNFINTFRREVGCSPRRYRASGLAQPPKRSTT